MAISETVSRINDSNETFLSESIKNNSVIPVPYGMAFISPFLMNLINQLERLLNSQLIKTDTLMKPEVIYFGHV